MPGLDDYGALLRSGAASVPDYAADEARRQLQQLQIGQEKRLEAAQQHEIDEEQGFQNDLTTVLAHPSAQGYSALIAKHPKFAQQVKSSWDLQDEAKQKADLQHMGEIYSAAANGKPALAAELMQRRLDADKAAGQEPDPHDQAILEALKSDDPVQQKGALGMMGVTLSAITGPDKFEQTLGALTKGTTPDIRNVNAGDDVISVDPVTGKATSIYKSPYVKTADGGILERDGTGGGDPASTGATGSVSPVASSVASALSSTGLPAPVVAGFMGNFHAEGGYDGAQGDGGSASGIGQWRGERAANFLKVVGKPVTEATPVEQAQFVKWEMDNPQAAGMTVKQRDAILAAKTPAQAAALIDQFYERSSGRDRNIRMAAANAFAGDASGMPPGSTAAPPGYHWLTPPKPKDAPSGFRWSADGQSLEPIPGGPSDPNGPKNQGPLNPDALRTATISYIKTGKMPAGMGGQALKNQILNFVPKIMEEQGLTPDDMPSIQQQFGADSAAFKQRIGQLSYMRQSVGKLNQHAQDLSALIKAMPLQGNFTPFNWITQGAEGMVSNSTIAQLRGGLPLFESEVARVMTGNPNSGAGQLSDDARHEFDILHSTQAPKAKIDAMNRIMKMVEESVKATRDETGTLKSRIGGGIDVYAGNGAPKTSNQGEQWITLPSGLKIRKIH